MLKQAMNQVVIRGILEEIDLSAKKDKRGRDYIGGSVTFLVRQTVSGKAEESHIQVRAFAYPMTNAGKPNKAYESIKNLMDNGISLAACGGDETLADKYTVAGASLATNTFPSEDGKDITYTFVRGSFFNKAKEIVPCATFTQDIVLVGMEEEVKEDTPTGRLMIKGICIGYNEIPDSFVYYVEDKNAIDYIKSYWAEEDTVEISGAIRMTSETAVKESTVEMGFGSPTATTYEKTTKEFIITAGSAGPLSDDKAYDPEEVYRACQKKKEDYEASKKPSMGFGATPTATANPRPVINRGW